MSTPLGIPPTDDATAKLAEPNTLSNFIRDIVADDLEAGRHDGLVITRFPPEPNGFLHIGHVKSICLNFGIANDFGGRCHLRFDDTNPETEDMKYVEAIQRDVRWLGFDWDEHLYFASDYFEQLYTWAVRLIEKGLAYVDSLSEEEIRDYRGTVTEPGRESPYRNRPVEENLRLFEQMKDGAFADGEHVLRAKIDMAHPNMKMRDPIMYRIRHADHYRRGGDWCIYPMYDWAHGQSDAIEDITHSICTLEFEINRELYDWYLDALGIDEPRNHQYEFARLNLDYTVTSKRKLLQLVQDGDVEGWDDPRMPTVAGMRRRGITPEALRDFCERIGVTKVDSRVDIAMLEYSIRDDLNFKAPRVLAVLRPLKVTITNWGEGETAHLEASYYPHDVPKEGSRQVPFGRTLYIERSDFREDPPKGFYRLTPGGEVRLRHAFVIRCDEVVKDEAGEVVELRCTYFPETKSGAERSFGEATVRKVKGTIHWVSAEHALPCEVRLYDRLFRVPNPDDVEEGETFKDYLNPDSKEILTGCYVEPSVADDPVDTRYQFERQGYFWRDPEDSSAEHLVFNRIITLRDSWAKQKAETTAAPAKPKAQPAEPQVVKSPEAKRQDKLAAFDDAQRRRYEQYAGPLEVDLDDAVILAEDEALARFYEGALAVHRAPQAVANFLVNVFLGEVKDRSLDALPFGPAEVGRLVGLVDDGTVSTRIAKDVFEVMLTEGGDPAEIVEEKGWKQVDDASAIAAILDPLFASNPDKVEAYRSGKTGLAGFFVGQVMRQTQGRANPQLVQKLVTEKLEAS